MADTLSPAARSERMKRVKQQSTSLELHVRKELHRRGLRYRIGGCRLPGRPDLVFPGRKAVAFVHGCFWHAHDCRLGRRPASNAEFWEQKALANRERDARKEDQLRALGWRVFVVWQCQLSRACVQLSLDQLATSLSALPGGTAAGHSAQPCLPPIQRMTFVGTNPLLTCGLKAPSRRRPYGSASVSCPATWARRRRRGRRSCSPRCRSRR